MKSSQSLSAMLTLDHSRCKAQSTGGPAFLSLRSSSWVYATLKKCYCEVVGKEKYIPNLYCTHLFSVDNLASSFNEKIEVIGWKISYYL